MLQHGKLCAMTSCPCQLQPRQEGPHLLTDVMSSSMSIFTADMITLVHHTSDSIARRLLLGCRTLTRLSST
jgi:hypothetical protein